MPHQLHTAEPLALSDPGLNRLKSVLAGWRTSLLDLGRRNRLLNFRHTRTATLEISSPQNGDLLAGIARGWDFEPVTEETDDTGRLPAEGQEPGQGTRGLVTQKKTQAGLASALYQPRQRSGQMFNDYGLWVLWLGIGMLNWKEDSAHDASCAPLHSESQIPQ